MTKVNFNLPMQENISRLKTSISLSAIEGNYWKFRKSTRELASIGVHNFDLVKNTKGLEIRNIQPFSKVYFKILKVLTLNFLRIKTKDEKQFKKMLQEDAMRENYKLQVRKRLEKEIRYDMEQKAKTKIDTMVNEKVDGLMNIIPEFIIKECSDAVVSKNGQDIESEINMAVKQIPKFLIKNNKNDLNNTVFNENFLKNL